MDTTTFTLILLSMFSTCNNSSTSSNSSNNPTSTGFSCWDYEIMLDVEVKLAQECTTDSECQQVLTGTGCGCETDDLVANTSFDTSYFFDLYDEALTQNCSIDFGTSCDCDASATPSCYAGSCRWD